jgi:hypothetical protein
MTATMPTDARTNADIHADFDEHAAELSARADRVRSILTDLRDVVEQANTLRHQLKGELDRGLPAFDLEGGFRDGTRPSDVVALPLFLARRLAPADGEDYAQDLAAIDLMDLAMKRQQDNLDVDAAQIHELFPLGYDEPVTGPTVHNHGPEDGPGLACPERLDGTGALRGACMDEEAARGDAH